MDKSNLLGWKSARAERRRAIAAFAVLTLASLIMAVNYRTFVAWGGLYPAGATGLSMLLQRLAQRFVSMHGLDWTVHFSPINFALNAIPIWIGFRFIGRRFTMRSLYVILMTGLLTDILPIDSLVSFISDADMVRLREDPFVTSLFGGIVFGFAMALCLRWNATTGGTDFIAIYLSEQKGRETWNLILALNGAILIAGGFVFGWPGTLYSIVYQFVTLQVVHLMYRTYQYQTLLIVTRHPKRICEAIYRASHHGATVVRGIGGYSGMPESIVYSVVAADDTTYIYALCKKIDSGAFINTMSTSRVIGRFYLRPRD
ncbi:MAG: YitT family protein [Kiritimatiellae bacterium]|nr:YitT family protein [Kiritimatiellia bacterium]